MLVLTMETRQTELQLKKKTRFVEDLTFVKYNTKDTRENKIVVACKHRNLEVILKFLSHGTTRRVRNVQYIT